MNRRDFLRQSSGALGAAALASRPAAVLGQAKPTLSLALTGDVIMSRRVSALADPRFLEVVKLAGIEIYKGKPIFYGLGDFFFQYETVRGYAADTYEAYGLPTHGTDPTKASDQVPLRGGRLLWETVVPVLEYDGDRLTGLVVHPVTLGGDLPRHARGTPMTASPADADKILGDLTRLSAAYGTRVTKDGARGRIALG